MTHPGFRLGRMAATDPEWTPHALPTNERLRNIETKLDALVSLVERLMPLIEYAEQKFGSRRRSFTKGSTK